MIAYIKGKLEMKMTEYVVIDVGGIGYKVFMSELGIENIGNIGDTVKVHTYYRVREDVSTPACFKIFEICEFTNALSNWILSESTLSPSTSIPLNKES